MNEKPRSISNLSLGIIIISVLIIFSNGMGIVANEILGISDDFTESDSEFNIMSMILSNYSIMCGVMISFGIFYLIGGLNLKKMKDWARKLIIVKSIILILIIWGIMLALALTIPMESEIVIFKIGAILNAIFWSTPLIILINFLNKKRIKVHFA